MKCLLLPKFLGLLEDGALGLYRLPVVESAVCLSIEGPEEAELFVRSALDLVIEVLS